MLHHRAVITLALLLTPVAQAAAQIRASELASVSQTVDGTVISLEYSRPRVRGRDAVFGDEVKWQEVWTPGANWATTIDVTKDVEINRHKVPKGKYSVWMVVRQDKPWTFVLDPRHRLFHVAHPDSADNQIRFDVETVAAPRVEVLAWSFPEVSPSSATLMMAWDTVQVRLQVDVPPSYARTITAAKAKDLLGQYNFKWKEDSTTYVLTLSHEKDELIGRWEPELFEGSNPTLMLFKSGDLFFPTLLQDGEIYEVLSDLGVEFKRKGDKVTGFEVRDKKDKLQATGVRR